MAISLNWINDYVDIENEDKVNKKGYADYIDSNFR